MNQIQNHNGKQGERYFLEGPHSRRRELRFAIKVFVEFIRGFRTMHFAGPCVTVFEAHALAKDIPITRSHGRLGKASPAWVSL